MATEDHSTPKLELRLSLIWLSQDSTVIFRPPSWSVVNKQVMKGVEN